MKKEEGMVCESIEDFIDRYANTIYRVLLQHMRNEADAQDVVQDTLIKIMKGHPCFDTIQKEKAWVLRVAINTCKDRWKYDKLRRHDELFDQYPQEEQQEWSILPYVMKLPQKYRDVIYLYYYEEYSVKEVAEILEKKEATILTWLRRARAKLKTMLEGSDWYEAL